MGDSERPVMCPLPYQRDGGVDYHRIVRAVAQMMVAEDRGLFKVDWRQAAEIVGELGFDWEEVKRAARREKRRVVKEVGELRTLSAWLKKGHRLRRI